MSHKSRSALAFALVDAMRVMCFEIIEGVLEGLVFVEKGISSAIFFG